MCIWQSTLNRQENINMRLGVIGLKWHNLMSLQFKKIVIIKLFEFFYVKNKYQKYAPKIYEAREEM